MSLPPDGTRRKRTVLGWLTIAMVAAACGAPTSAPPEGATTETPPTTQPTTDQTVPAVDREAMKEDQDTAVKAVDSFWHRHFTQQSGQPYQSPRVAGSYIGTHGPPCGGEPESVPFNAVYCRPGDFVAWDDDLMAAGYSQIGDAWVYLIIAHEWGHAIQARLRSDRVSVAAELQADCLAGATLQGAADDGLITIEPGDSEEIAKTLAAVADDYPWTKESDHGNAEQRTSAFNTGVEGGVGACI
jgi:predicted metalloprotease